ncbi:hypothetical protein CEXT_636951 [Caerostris extrusa]|uniref:Uncharacterized protein n=1 Tax=Caerostris extrusa TaxID=172846 RepID=A0AAV4TD98_CAEEX|nr:hypothetical protein CEXT_636951 [Caerostris extrusa]
MEDECTRELNPHQYALYITRSSGHKQPLSLPFCKLKRTASIRLAIITNPLSSLTVSEEIEINECYNGPSGGTESEEGIAVNLNAQISQKNRRESGRQITKYQTTADPENTFLMGKKLQKRHFESVKPPEGYENYV